MKAYLLVDPIEPLKLYCPKKSHSSMFVLLGTTCTMAGILWVWVHHDIIEWLLISPASCLTSSMTMFMGLLAHSHHPTAQGNFIFLSLEFQGALLSSKFWVSSTIISTTSVRFYLTNIDEQSFGEVQFHLIILEPVNEWSDLPTRDGNRYVNRSNFGPSYTKF